jgi:hypothetical protein
MNIQELQERVANNGDDDDHDGRSVSSGSDESGVVSDSSGGTYASPQKDQTHSSAENPKSNCMLKASKMIVLSILACAAAVVGVLTHSYIANQEEEDFHRQVNLYSYLILVSATGV